MSELFQEILQDAVFEERGNFTLAADKAREKMRRFQLQNPRCYLLAMVTALVASGASAVDIATEEGDVEEGGADGLSFQGRYRLQVDFEGPGYTAGELESLYDAPFLSGEGAGKDRLRDLALGVLACQGLPARSIEIRSGGALWIWDGQTTSVQRDRVPQGNRITVVGSGTPEELRLLGPACLSVPIPLRLNGSPLSTPHDRWSPQVPWPAWHFQNPEGEGVVGLPDGCPAASRISLLRHGVQFAERRLPDLRPPVSLAVEAARLRRTVSQTDVVEDETWQALLASLPGVLLDLAGAVASRETPTYHREAVRSFLLRAMAEWLPAQVVAHPQESWPPYLAFLARAPSSPTGGVSG